MKIKISDAQALSMSGSVITSGMIGRTLELEFSPEWDGLGIIACFTAGTVSKDVYVSPVNRAASIDIPWECLQTDGVRLTVGFYGTRTEVQSGTSVTVLAIPTVYLELGTVQKGATASGETGQAATPTAVQTMLSAAAEAVSTAQSVRDDADNGVFDGEPGEDGADGHSPVVTATKVGKVTTVSVDGTAIAAINDGNDGANGQDGADGADGQDGQDGADGHSPVVTATKVGKVTTVSVDGTAIAAINDGNDGANGQDGADGQDGQDGADGHSPVVTATKVGKVTTVSVDGTAIAAINDGNDGANGTNGYTPVRGTDYWTTADINTIKGYVDDAILNGAW